MKRLMLALNITVISSLFHPTIAIEPNPQQAVAPSKEMGSDNYFAFSNAIRKNQIEVAQVIAEKTKSPFAERAIKVKKMNPDMPWASVLEKARNLQNYDKFMEDSKPSPIMRTKNEEETAPPQNAEEEIPTSQELPSEPSSQLSDETSNVEMKPPETVSTPPGYMLIESLSQFFMEMLKDRCISFAYTKKGQNDLEEFSKDFSKMLVKNSGEIDSLIKTIPDLYRRSYENKNYSSVQKQQLYEMKLEKVSLEIYNIFANSMRFCQPEKK